MLSLTSCAIVRASGRFARTANEGTRTMDDQIREFDEAVAERAASRQRSGLPVHVTLPGTCPTCGDVAYDIPCPDCEVMDVEGDTQAARDVAWAELRAQHAEAMRENRRAF